MLSITRAVQRTGINAKQRGCIPRDLAHIVGCGGEGEAYTGEEALASGPGEQADEEIEKDLKVEVAPTDACMVSPLLLKAGWHKYVAPNSLAKKISGWRNLASLPTAEKAQWKGLREATEAYFKKAVDFIDHTDTLVLKHLNSPNPVKQ
ncbi:hypothetical protein BKA83DRAFT_4495327 [Pisolithus microcarpus]|nr:hypothetical protein BKA83DRAFT_4495327 [Pisolithus microcarpus]